jgi:hypothetical protein
MIGDDGGAGQSVVMTSGQESKRRSLEASAVQPSQPSFEQKALAQEWVVFYIVELVTAMALGVYLISQTKARATYTSIGLIVAVLMAAQQLLQVVRLLFAGTAVDARLLRASGLAEAHSVMWIAIMLLYVTVWSLT